MAQNSAKGRAWDAQRLRVLNRDDWTCTACGVALEGDNATVDHVAAVSKNLGKVYADDELTSLCRPCNSRKGDRTIVRLDYRNPRWFDGIEAVL